MGSRTIENPPWVLDVSPDELRRIVDALYRVHQLISLITDLDDLLEHVMEESKAVARAEACSLMLYDPKSEELYFHVALGEHGDQQALKREIRLKLGQGIGGIAAAKRQSINVEDVRNYELWYRPADERSRFETRSVLAVPLFDQDKLIGVLEVVNKHGGGPFLESDLRVMEIFSSVVATAVAKARLIEDNLRAERLAAIGEAVAGLSHYAKNIITGMGGSVDLIDQGLRTNNVDTLRRSWPILRRSCLRISSFVEDMLAYSKRREPVREPCRVDLLLRDAAETFQELLVRKNTELCIDTEGLKGPFPLDPRGILRCLLNLLSNAADAVANESGRIWLSARTLPDGAVEMAVADNGPGIPDEYRDRVCEPFFSTKGTQGTGLGLAVTSKAVLEHKGVLHIERSQAGGALFRIVLPLPQDAA